MVPSDAYLILCIIKYTVECLLARRDRGGDREYKVKWEGYPESEATWATLSELGGCKKLMNAFDRKHPNSTA